MGSSFHKAKKRPKLVYVYTMTVKNIIAKVNRSHPYVVRFLDSYPYSVNYTNAGHNFQWLLDYEPTYYTFRTHVHYVWDERCSLTMTTRQFKILNAIANFIFDKLPTIKAKMTVGDLRAIYNIANRKVLAEMFKYSPEVSEWASVPIPTIYMHIKMVSIPDKTSITLSVQQNFDLAKFLHKPFIQDVQL